MKFEITTLNAKISGYEYPNDPRKYFLSWMEITLYFGDHPIHTWRLEGKEE